MSGGVDSSVAAALLVEAGHDVVGVFLRLGPGGAPSPAGHRSCCSVDDARDAGRVADRLGIPFYPLDYEREFARVIDDFVDEYERGRTPNPCARCNQWVKFGTLFEQARALGCDRVATGHYARITRDARGAPELRRGADPLKDQSYFLFTIPRSSLEMTEFPIGHLSKEDCRRLARERGLPVADKPDSQEICFVPGGDYRAVLAARSPETIRPGAFVDPAGAVLGEHPGHQHFTIGQRRGIGRAFGEPRYVIGIDADRNTVTLGPRELLAATGCRVDGVRWVSRRDPGEGARIEARVQIRHRAAAARAVVTTLAGGAAEIEFLEAQDAVAPGQAAVFYRDDVLLGGGWIAASRSAR
jgi:tRNA-specific 2-thiouridylase